MATSRQSNTAVQPEPNSPSLTEWCHNTGRSVDQFQYGEFKKSNLFVDLTKNRSVNGCR